MRRFLIALFVLLAFPSLAENHGARWTSPLATDHPLVGKIWLPRQNRFIGATDLASRLASADLVLLGERHDNPDHHRLQAWALEKILAAGRRPLIAFEMIGPEQEDAMILARQNHPDDPDAIATAIDWSHSGWSAWPEYRPLFAFAVAHQLPIRAANLPRDDMRAIARAKTLTPQTAAQWGLDHPLDDATRTAMADEIRGSHCGMLPEEAVAGMVNVQRARDRAMALAVTGPRIGGAVLIAGAGHTRIDRGVPAHLKMLADSRSQFSLAFAEVADDRFDPAAYGESWGTEVAPFDALWFTPRANDDDPCAQMTEFMRKKQDKAGAAASP